MSFSLLGCWHPACPTDQPDNPGEENCGVIRTESSGGWQNHDCSIALPYVCKKKPNATATAELIQPGEPVTGGQFSPSRSLPTQVALILSLNYSAGSGEIGVCH